MGVLYTEEALTLPSQSQFGTITVQTASSSLSEAYEKEVSGQTASLRCLFLPFATLLVNLRTRGGELWC